MGSKTLTKPILQRFSASPLSRRHKVSMIEDSWILILFSSLTIKSRITIKLAYRKYLFRNTQFESLLSSQVRCYSALLISWCMHGQGSWKETINTVNVVIVFFLWSAYIIRTMTSTWHLYIVCCNGLLCENRNQAHACSYLFFLFQYVN